MTQASTSVSENDIRLDKISTLHSGKKIMIQLELQRSTSLQIALFNMNGQRVLNKASQSFTTGFHTIEVDGSSLPSGSYIISIQNEKTKATGKVTL
jgi:flagellar hook assembly protein FlgD